MVTTAWHRWPRMHARHSGCACSWRPHHSQPTAAMPNAANDVAAGALPAVLQLKFPGEAMHWWRLAARCSCGLPARCSICLRPLVLMSWLMDSGLGGDGGGERMHGSGSGSTDQYCGVHTGLQLSCRWAIQIGSDPLMMAPSCGLAAPFPLRAGLGL